MDKTEIEMDVYLFKEGKENVKLYIFVKVAGN